MENVSRKCSLIVLCSDVSILCLFCTGYPGGLGLRLSIGGC